MLLRAFKLHLLNKNAVNFVRNDSILVQIMSQFFLHKSHEFFLRHYDILDFIVSQQYSEIRKPRRGINLGGPSLRCWKMWRMIYEISS
jgi:hypothetical protein